MEIKISCYQMVAFLFRLTLVYQWSSTGGKDKNVCDCLRKSLNFILALFFILKTSVIFKYSLFLSRHTVDSGFLDLIFTSVVAFVFRLMLLKQEPLLENMEKRFRESKDNLFRLGIFSWCVLHGLYHLIVFLMYTNSEETTNRLDCRVETFVFAECSDTTKIVMSTIHLFLFDFMFWMPLDTFGIFFVVTCHHVCGVLRRYERSLSARSRPDYKLLLAEYLEMKKMVLGVDSDLSSLLFVFMVYTMDVLFSGYNVYLSIMSGIWDLHALVRLMRFLYGAFSFFLLYNAARRVSDTSLRISEKATHLPQNPQQSPLYHILFIMNTEKELTMTMFGGIRMNKQFFLAYFGTVTSYLVLYDTIAR